MLTHFTSATAASELRCGALAKHMDALASSMWERGYARSTACFHLRVIADFSRWLAKKEIGARDVVESYAEQFLRHRHRRRLHRGDWASLRLLLRHLRETGVVSARVAVGDSCTELLSAFTMYLRRERGASTATEKNYGREVTVFLRHRFGKGPVTPSLLRSKDLYRFVSWRAQHVSALRVKLTVTALRAFGRFLRFRGDIATELASSVLSVPNWRLSTLPKAISQADVDQIVAQCDRGTTVGRRNYAILLLLARLGLRASEVVLLTLDDVDWDSGELVVHGKGSRLERVPLPPDVGKALAEYLRRDRPRCSTRRFFVRVRAPVRGFGSPAMISTIVADAIERAKLDPPSRGAHLLRYSLATNLLRRGGSLPEVSELLRHRHPDTTALYAKVDLEPLRSVAQPWPGGRR